MFELTFLGTSASAPSIQRGLSSAVVQINEHRFMIDCGEGSQRQLLRSGLGFRRLDKILLTHGHLDHILGLGGLASTLGRWEALDELNIFGGEPALERVGALMQVVFGWARGSAWGCISNPWRREWFSRTKISSWPPSRGQPSGWGLFWLHLRGEAPSPLSGPIRRMALGIPNGPVRRDLAQGQAITLADGRAMKPEQVLGEAERGAKLCFVGDVGRTGPLHKIVEGADCHRGYLFGRRGRHGQEIWPPHRQGRGPPGPQRRGQTSGPAPRQPPLSPRRTMCWPKPSPSSPTPPSPPTCTSFRCARARMSPMCGGGGNWLIC